MLTLNISEADIARANYERISNKSETIRKRMDAIYWTSQGFSRKKVTEISGIHRNSVKTYIKLFNKGGLEVLKTFQYKGFDSVLMGHRVTLKAYFEKHPPRTAKEAAAKVEELTGEKMSVDEVRRFMHKIGMKPMKTGHIPAKADVEKQQQFLDEVLLPLIQLAHAGECHLFFVDAAHFALMPFVGILWCFARMFVKAAPGRNRLNVLGALHVGTLKMETVVNDDFVNSGTVAELLKKLSQNYLRFPIYVIMDNARYQHCEFIKTLAVSLGIHLVFLPPYSPNLNLIERIWRYIRKDVLSTHYYDCAQKFHQAIRQALEDINGNQRTKNDLRTLLVPNFQTFAQYALAQ